MLSFFNKRKQEKSVIIYYRVIQIICYVYSDFYDGNNCDKKSYKNNMKCRACCGCKYCFKTKRKNELSKCKGCRFVRYCSKKCQKIDWNKHH